MSKARAVGLSLLVGLFRAVGTGLTLWFMGWLVGIDFDAFTINEKFFFVGLCFVAYISADAE